MMRKAWLYASRLAVAVAIPLALTFAGSRLLSVNATTIGFVYLLFVLVIAAGWGLFEAVVASCVSTLCFNFYFFPPVGTFTIADPQNWVALISFLVSAVVGSQLSAHAKAKAAEALARREEIERLYTLSRSILLIDPSQSVPAQLAFHIAQSFELESVVLFHRATGEFFRAGSGEFPGLDDQLREAALQGTTFHDAARSTVITAVRLGTEPIASLGLASVSLSDSALQGLANVAAIGLERAKAQHAAALAEAARKSDELKSTLLDAIAHEFKTPLTSIKAAASSLRGWDGLPEDKRELAVIADEEADHLAQLVTEALEMTRIEAGRVQMQRRPADIADLVRSVVSSMTGAFDGRDVRVRFPDELPAANVDTALIEIVLRQLLDNALKYSTPDSPITVEAHAEDSFVAVSVANEGPGIPEAEQEHLFDKFYRSPAIPQRIAGTGMGLTIAREIVHLHGGSIAVESRPGRTEFRFRVPAAKRAEG